MNKQSLKSILVFFLSIICFSGVYAEDYTPAVIIKKNGKNIECLVDKEYLAGSSYLTEDVKYKDTKNSQEKRMQAKDIHQVVFQNPEENSISLAENVEFVSAKKYAEGDFSKKKKMFLGVIQTGHITLYSWSVIVQQLKKTYYVCKKKNESAGVNAIVISYVGSPYSDKVKIRVPGNDFKNCYEKLFKEHTELCNSIRSGKLKEENFEEIVREYNTFMEQKK